MAEKLLNLLAELIGLRLPAPVRVRVDSRVPNRVPVRVNSVIVS